MTTGTKQDVYENEDYRFFLSFFFGPGEVPWMVCICIALAKELGFVVVLLPATVTITKSVN